MYYHVCERCGATLDPSERCDCKKKAPKPASSNGAKDTTSFPYVITGKGKMQLKFKEVF